MFHLMTHSTHFNYGYMALDIWWMTTMPERKPYSATTWTTLSLLAVRDLLHAPSHRLHGTHHSLCHFSRGALAGMRCSSMGPPLCIDLMTHHTMCRHFHRTTSRSLYRCQNKVGVTRTRTTNINNTQYTHTHWYPKQETIYIFVLIICHF